MKDNLDEDIKIYEIELNKIQAIDVLTNDLYKFEIKGEHLHIHKKAIENVLSELETYKKIAEKLAEEMALHGICSGVEESDKCYADEIKCGKCIIDWARNEVTNDK